jgi:hypothetical protein
LPRVDKFFPTLYWSHPNKFVHRHPQKLVDKPLHGRKTFQQGNSFDSLIPLSAVSFSFVKPPDISEDFRLQFSVLGMRSRLEDPEAIIHSEDLLKEDTRTRDAVFLCDIPVDFRIRSHSIKATFYFASRRRLSGAIYNIFKLTASRTANMADQAFYQLTNRTDSSITQFSW